MIQTYPTYFDLDRTPAILDGPRAVPRIYRGGGRWEPYPNSARLLTEAEEIDREKFLTLVKVFDSQQKKKSR